MLNSAPTERWPSGRRRTPGKCVYGNVSRVRIPPSPPTLRRGAVMINLRALKLSEVNPAKLRLHGHGGFYLMVKPKGERDSAIRRFVAKVLNPAFGGYPGASLARIR